MSIAAARRLDNLPPYVFATLGKKIAEMRAAGHDVIRLHVGSPDMPPPEPVIETLQRSARNKSNHGYAGYSGTPGFREAIAGYYSERFQVELDPSSELLPLIGSKEGIAHLALAYLDPGDIALVPDPAFPAYAMSAALAGADSYAYPLSAEKGFLPNLDAIPGDVLARSKMMWINYPNNPTGASASLDDLTELVEFAREHGILLCSDNPYADVTFDGESARSILEVEGAKDVAVEFNTLSKAYNMAGWRAGMFVGAAEAVKALLAVKSNVDSGLFTAICDASEVALNETPRSWIEERNAIYQDRRDLILEMLPQVGLSAETPKAALYIWAKVEDRDDIRYAREVLEQCNVSIAAGSAYGENGRGYVRIAIVTPRERLLEALERIRDWYQSKN